ncbi:tRNA preQ1(34) S-adenosylmethionine ribosyltransferase-isomerase QueA [Spirochaeta africana]|uniref:S-adenosylmethionine:tRNA ribosyltransferase-isomerase n=1 Tax=Spirochaeta africana (strain ATCC 700263 / DSM 8902 / Z-7692) TaxID=889378 RepID=H9UJB6_SPIAZ|nr:tRNA preQ1(34) S-adenosylmethionine ribosyltransferase-isomerase QueA [Spirochaeta africana]AFG37609.1 S-adenosylmethionine:tRNA ribosyltransferase-isomerase [Spirochaeta africana DSM 8902]
MLTKDFSFELPEELIAQLPTEERGASRMMVLDAPESGAETAASTASGANRYHRMVADIVDLLPANTVMVVNNSRVRRARLEATTRNGGTVEVLLLRHIHETGKGGCDGAWEVMLSKAKRRRPGEILGLPGDRQLEIRERQDSDSWLVTIQPGIDDDYLQQYGRVPLPPYIRRMHQDIDLDRYQTVYAETTGSVAAPTAGLHFTPEILSRIREKGIQLCSITLHVGLGTFLPVRAERITDHAMHREEYTISKETARAVEQARAAGRPVLAVGTTSVRALESSWQDDNTLATGAQSTDIFIYPGYRFRAVDMLFTNFHTPESTLLMLVSAFAGKERILAAYQEAVQLRYRFFSYGDAMLINRWSRPLLQNQP